MSQVWKDRVLETSTSTGTGNLTLSGAVAGFRAFSAVCATNDTVYYYIEAVDGNGIPTGDWETGLGTYSASNTLTRTTVIDSSNAGAAVSFSAGTKRAGLCSPARAQTWHLAGSWVYSSDVANVDFTGLGQYGTLMVMARNITLSASGIRVVYVSVNGGSTFYSTSGDYINIADTGIESAATDIIRHLTATTAARSIIGIIENNHTGAIKRCFTQLNINKSFVASTAAIDALRVTATAGNLTGGTIDIYGRP